MIAGVLDVGGGFKEIMERQFNDLSTSVSDRRRLKWIDPSCPSSPTRFSSSIFSISSLTRRGPQYTPRPSGLRDILTNTALGCHTGWSGDCVCVAMLFSSEPWIDDVTSRADVIETNTMQWDNDISFSSKRRGGGVTHSVYHLQPPCRHCCMLLSFLPTS